MGKRVDRRLFLKGCVAAGAVGAGLLTARPARAAWPKSAFAATTVEQALAALGLAGATRSDHVVLKAPDIAENGAVVPVEVRVNGLDGVESITLLAEANRLPLLEHLLLTSQAMPYLSTRVKMAKTMNVIAVVKAGGKVYSGTKEVKVTIGGID